MDGLDEPRVLDRVTTPRGELVLRRVGDHLEVVSSGIFLMDTRGGGSERALVREALRAHGAARSLLVGGLGVGFSLLEAVRHPTLDRVVVVEIEQRVLDWHATHLAHLTATALADRRVEVLVADVADHLASSAGAYDVVCLDVDNGPEWPVTDDNAALYTGAGLAGTIRALRPDGILGVWSSAVSPAFESLLREQLTQVRVLEIDAPAPRGGPDVVYLGRRPG